MASNTFFPLPIFFLFNTELPNCEYNEMLNYKRLMNKLSHYLYLIASVSAIHNKISPFSCSSLVNQLGSTEI